MMRKAFVMSVNAGSEQEYERRHSPIWAELEKTLKDHGVISYSIFIHPETRQLFGYVEIEDEDIGDLAPLMTLLRRFATEAAREEARLFCDELVGDAEEAQQQPGKLKSGRSTRQKGAQKTPPKHEEQNVR